MRHPNGVMRWALAFAVVLVAVALLQAPARLSRTTSGTDSLRIGVAMMVEPRGTPDDIADAEMLYAVRDAVQQLNTRRGPGVAPLAIRLPPSPIPAQTTLAYTFRDDPAVIGVVGPLRSGVVMETGPIYGDAERNGERAVVSITPSATNPAVTRINPWVFRVCPTDDDMAEALAAYAADSLGARRAAVVYRNDLFGRGFASAFQKAFEARGGEVTERDPFVTEAVQIGAYARSIAAGGAEVVVFAGEAGVGASLIRELRRLGSRAAVLGADEIAEFQANPERAREFQGVRYPSMYDPRSAATPAESAFVARWRRKHGTPPTYWAAMAFDAAMLIGRASQEVGPDRARIRDWIASVGRQRPPFPGATGPIRFDEHNDPVGRRITLAEVRP